MKRDRTRKLRIEHLERREMLSADVFSNGGAYLTSGIPLRREAALLDVTVDHLGTSSTWKTLAVIAGNASDLNGALLDENGEPEYSVIFVHGGKAGSHGKALGPDGRDAVREFVFAGGSYVGSCAGAGLAADYSPNVLGLWKGAMAWSGSGWLTVDFSGDPDHHIAHFLVEHGIDDMVVRNIPHYGGPRFSPDMRHPEGTEFVGKITGASSGLRKHIGTPYLVEYQPTADSGVMLLQPSHPEYGRRNEHTILNAALLDYAISRAQNIPVRPEPEPLPLAVELAYAELGRGPRQVGMDRSEWPGPLSQSLVGRSPPWCSEFVSWAYAAGGVPFVNGSHGGWMLDSWSKVIRHFSNAGQYVKKGSVEWVTYQPKPGDYLYSQGHSAMVYSVDGDTIQTIEGNIQNRVVSRTIENWRTSRILGVGIL